MRRPRGNLKAVWSEQGPAREYDTRTYESGEHATLARLPGALVEERRQLVEEEESSGRYDFTALLGEGGMGEVRLCMDRRIQRAAFKQAYLLAQDHRHPSLRALALEGLPGYYRVRVATDVRLLYRRTGDRQNEIEILSLIDREDLDRYVRQAKTRG